MQFYERVLPLRRFEAKYRTLTFQTNNTLCTIWYHLHNLKNVKNTHRRVLLLVKLLAETCNFTKSNTPPLVFLTVFKKRKWHQIVAHLFEILRVELKFRYISTLPGKSYENIYHSNLWMQLDTGNLLAAMQLLSLSFSKNKKYETLCTIWYYLYNWKSNNPPWVFFTFFNPSRTVYIWKLYWNKNIS